MMIGQFDEQLLKMLEKARKYCAAEERCKMAVEEKLISWGVENGNISLIINKLEEENFLSEKRFAELFAHSKVNQNKWGKIKIELELQNRNIPEKIISESIAGIDEEQYLKNFVWLIETKAKEWDDLDPMIRKQKLITFLTAKGYEGELIENHLNL